MKLYLIYLHRTKKKHLFYWFSLKKFGLRRKTAHLLPNFAVEIQTEDKDSSAAHCYDKRVMRHRYMYIRIVYVSRNAELRGMKTKWANNEADQGALSSRDSEPANAANLQ